MSAPDGFGREVALEWARAELQAASGRLAMLGVPGTMAEGQLIRPLVAIGGLNGAGTPPPGFWDTVLAVQLAHEASLLHDDVIDRAASRRGAPTVAAGEGVARALVMGDHLLTAAYRAAASTGDIGFVSMFARAVERTVAGEAEQGRVAGRVLTLDEYREIVLGKSGELLGCALAAAATLSARSDANVLFELGRRLGLLYQMLDDLLDYCPSTDTGKPALGDYASERWTWVLAEFPPIPMGLSPDELLERMYGSPLSRLSADRLRQRMVSESDALIEEITALLPADLVVRPMIAEWLSRAEEAIDLELSRRPSSSVTDSSAEPAAAEGEGTIPGSGRSGRVSRGGWVSPPSARGLGSIGGHARWTGRELPTLWSASVPPATVLPIVESPGSDVHDDLLTLFAEHFPSLAAVTSFQAGNSHSFRFASRFFPREEAARIARVYAFCRVMDDLVDTPPDGHDPERLLDGLLATSRSAYAGDRTGLPLLDRVMSEMAEAAVPFHYVEDLAEGMRMDLRGDRYDRIADLHLYAYRVASVVGLWVTRLSGFDSPSLMDRAVRMGRAMQVTNILRDVGEDLRRGRLYLPREMMEQHGISEDALRAGCEGAGVPPGYMGLIEELMELAEEDYAAGLAALFTMPGHFARPVAVAAHVYRGIHDEIRRNGYDNLRHRARTGAARKYLLAANALWRLRADRVHLSATATHPIPIGLGARK